MRGFLLCFAFLPAMINFLIQPAFSQEYNLKTDPPFDPEVVTGVLDNGMRYYIRQNKLPENRGEFYIATNVGAIQEEDDQNGLAHFNEHMAFNGTRHFPKKGILDYMATIGVKFGQNVNAGTGVEQTIYMLTSVPLLREGIIDTCLLVLHDWSHYLSFDSAEVELERGVIMEEWRMYGSASERMGNKLAPVKFKGSKYATRDIIGDTAVIRHFRQETLKKFYRDWYRPDLQAIAVIGDFDPKLMEKKISKLFGQIPRTENPVPKEIYPLPDNKAPLFGVATDPEATRTMVEVYFKHPSTEDRDKNLGYMRTTLVRNLINAMFGQRMNDLTRTENPPFISAYSYYGGYTKTRDAFVGVAQAKNNEGIPALYALLTEIERMHLHGFTPGELERAKSNLLRNYESRYLDKDKRKNRELVYPILFHFLRNNPNPGLEYEYQFAKTMIPGITLDEINEAARAYVTRENMVVVATGPEKEGVVMPSVHEMERVVETLRTERPAPYVDEVAGKQLLDREPVPGKVLTTVEDKVMGTTTWTLSNGARVIFKPTDFREDELFIKAYSAGGQSRLADGDLVVADLLGSAVSDQGVGDFSRTDLTKLLAGKRVTLNLWLSDDQDVMNLRTSPKDLETALQMAHLQFTRPRWDETDFNTWLEKQKAQYVNADAEPRKAFYDSVNVMLGNHSPRAIPMSYRQLAKVTLAGMKRVYEDRYADPGNFTFQFVGNIRPEDARPLVERYLASLPQLRRDDSFRDDGVRPPKGKVANDFTRENKTPRTSVFVGFTGQCPYTSDDKVLAAALRHCLELRYIESIREDEGGTYSVRVSMALSRLPEPNFMMNVVFDTDPVKADKLVGIVHREVAVMLESGPREVDLQKAKEYFLKQRQEDLKENSWWSNLLLDHDAYGMNFLSGYEEKVRNLDIRSVHEFARRTLSQGNALEVIMRP